MSLDHEEVCRKLQKLKTKVNNLLNYIEANRLEPNRASVDTEICSQLRNISTQVIRGELQKSITKHLTNTYIFTVKFFDADNNVWSGSAIADHHDKAMDIIEATFESTELVSRWSGECEVEYPDDYEPSDGW